MKWTEEQTVNFVTEYVSYECLYDPNCGSYRNKELKNAAIIAISNALGIRDFGPKEVYLKIKSIRSTYSQELKKIKERKSGAGAYTPRLKWFNMLHEALTAVNSTEESRESTYNNEPFFQIEIQKVENDFDEYENDTVSNEESLAGSEATSQISNDAIPILPKSKNLRTKPRKRILKEYDNSVPKVQHIANGVNSSCNSVEQSENEFDIFGKSIAAQLKNMPLDMAIEAQMLIQNHLSELRLKTIRSSSSHYSNMAPPLTQTSSPASAQTSTSYVYSHDSEDPLSH